MKYRANKPPDTFVDEVAGVGTLDKSGRPPCERVIDSSRGAGRRPWLPRDPGCRQAAGHDA